VVGFQIQRYKSFQAVDQVYVDGNFLVANLIEPHDVHSCGPGLEPALAARLGDAIVGRAAFLGLEAHVYAAGSRGTVWIANLHVDFGDSIGTAAGISALRPDWEGKEKK